MDWIYDLITWVLLVILGILLKFYFPNLIKTELDKSLNTHQSLNQVKVYISQKKFDYEMELYTTLVSFMYDSFSTIGLIASEFDKYVSKNVFFHPISRLNVKFDDFFNDSIVKCLNDLIDYHAKHIFQFPNQIDNQISISIDFNNLLVDKILIERNDFLIKGKIDTYSIQVNIKDNLKLLSESIDKCNELIRDHYFKLDIK